MAVDEVTGIGVLKEIFYTSGMITKQNIHYSLTFSILDRIFSCPIGTKPSSAIKSPMCAIINQGKNP